MHYTDGIRAILFDWDGTLRHSRPSFTQFFFDLTIKSGVPDSQESRLRSTRWLHYYWAQSPEMLADRQTYGDREEDFWANHVRLNLIAFGCSSEQAAILAPEIYRQMVDEYKPEDWVPPDVPETLRNLKDAGYILGVASNRTSPYRDQLETLGLAGYFEFALAAGEVDSWKPDPVIFHQAVQRLDVQPHEALYVGDNYYADVVGAQRIGLKPVLIDPEGVFPEAECPVIHEIGELPELLDV